MKPDGNLYTSDGAHMLVAMVVLLLRIMMYVFASIVLHTSVIIYIVTSSTCNITIITNRMFSLSYLYIHVCCYIRCYISCYITYPVDKTLSLLDYVDWIYNGWGPLLTFSLRMHVLATE